MFDTKSDFALNKFDRDAIVCRSVTGVHIRLTRAAVSYTHLTLPTILRV